MSSTDESAAFEHGEESFLHTPSPKRVRFDHPHGEQMQVVETFQTEDPNEVGTVTITVPSSQFEIEINSQVEDDEGEEIQRSDLTGPAFGIVRDPQDLPSMDESAQSDEGGTLNAIGRALLQMQQGNHTQQAQTSPSNQQIFFTRNTSTSEADTSSQNAPLYVMIPPASSAEILQAMGQTRPIAPKTSSPPLSLNMMQEDPTLDVKSREAQRKATHNEVERRRRDRINELIKMLAMIVPGCQKKDATTGNIVGYVYSKGTVLDKTVEFLKELLTQNEQLAGTAKLAEKSASALSLVQNQITVLEKENAFLRAQIIQFGIDAAASNSQPSNVSRQLLNSPLAQSLLNTVAQASMAATPPQPPAPPPPQAPPPPAPASSQVTAQQLLISLAQSLTNSPLLTSPAHPGILVPTTSPPRLPTPVAVTSTPTRLPPSMQAVSPIPSHQTHATSHPVPTHLTTQVAPTPQQQQQHQQQQQQQLQLQLQATPSHHQQAQPSNSSQSLAPLITSLVQTLASLANPSTGTTMQSLAPPPPPQPVHKASPPPPPRAQTPPQAPPTSGGGLSAAAAASLLNTLIMAQNVLTHTGTGGVAHGGGGDSMLSSMGLDVVSRGEQ